MRGMIVAAVALACALPSASAQAQNLALQAPGWAAPLVGADTMPTTGGRAAIAADDIPVAVRVTIAPVDGGVARVIRYDGGEAPKLVLRRFTGDPRTGWWPWGPDAPYVTTPAAAARTEVENLARATLAASATAQTGGPVATAQRCSGEQAFVEVAAATRATSFTRACVTSADAVGRLALRLSALAGSRDNAELSTAAAEEVLAADRAFAALAASEGVPAAFARYAAHDAIMLRSSGDNTVGHDAVVARFESWPEDAALEWMPRAARVSSRGDMAWSWGDSIYVAADGTRTPGRYFTAWTRDEEGEWRFAIDGGVD